MNTSRLRSLWDRLAHDTAFRVATVYAGASWFLIQAMDTLGGSTALIRGLAAVLAVGFLVVVPAVWVVERRAARREGLDEIDAHWGVGPRNPVRRSRKGLRRWALGVMATVVLALGAWWLGTRSADAAIPDSASRLAVLPFHATGSESVRELGVGLVDLLSAAMNDVAGIRTVSSRTVLARIPDPDGTLPLDRALAVGREVGAGSVLTGSATAVTGTVRLHGEIVSVDDGVVLASADAEGPEDRVLPLVDDLAVRLLRELWQSRDPLPTVNTAALTTRSPAALRSYLRGEVHLRAMRIDSAMAAFSRAVADDSTFALAWLRLTESAGWVSGGGPGESLEQRERYVERAARFSDRLPERERSLVRAVQLSTKGDLEAFDSLDVFVRRFPDDPYGWYLLGDARYHAGSLGLHGFDEIVQPFRQASTLDPSFGLGLVHALDLAVDRGDRSEFERLLERYARVARAEDVEVYRRQARIRWAPPDSLVAVFLHEAGDLDPAVERRRIDALVGALGNRVRLDPEVDPLVYATALDSSRALFPDNRDWQLRARSLRALHLLSLGRAHEGLEALDEWLDLDPATAIPVGPARRRAFAHTLQGISFELPPGVIADDLAALQANVDAVPVLPLVLHFYYMTVGRLDRAGQYPLDLAAAAGAGPATPDSAGTRLMIEGWEQLLRGDSATALARFDEGVSTLGFWAWRIGPPTALPYARLLAATPARRQRGIRMLRWMTTYSTSQTGQAYLALARALEDGGEVEEARAAYGHVLRLWSSGDDYLQDEVAEARQALERLTAEARDS